MITKFTKTIICIIPLLFIQCVEQTAMKNVDKMEMKNKKILPEPEYVKLMSIEDLTQFKAFISDEDNKVIILRIPLTAIFKESRVFGPDQYLIGDLKEGGENIELKLNDTRMGIGINAHLQSECGDERCTFWVDIQWHGMNAEHSKANENGAYEVMAVGFTEDSADLDREFVYVRK